MRIFYIGKFDTPSRTENYVTHALTRLGCQVIRHDAFQCQRLTKLKRTIKEHAPQVVLFSKQDRSYNAELIKWCRDVGIPTVTWVWDLFWGYRPERPHQFKADLLFSTDGGHDAHWERYGANHQVLRQGIHRPDHKMFEREKTCDVIYAGGIYPYRRTLLRFVRKHFGLTIFQNTRGLALNRRMARSKIVLGDSYPSPHYWSNRIYETLGRGGFLLHPETEGLDEEFEDGVHYVSYKRGDFDGLAETIEYYLTHPRERERIRVQGFDHVGRHYTYDDRCRVLLREIRERIEIAPQDTRSQGASRSAS